MIIVCRIRHKYAQYDLKGDILAQLFILDMDIILLILKCFILIIVGTLVFFIGQGLVVLFIFFLGFINDHSRNNDDIDEEYYKVDKQKKEIERKELKKINDEYDRQINLYNSLLSGYDMPKSFFNELTKNLPVYLYSQKKKGLLKEEEYRRRIWRWFGLIEGYFPEIPNIKTGDFKPVDHEDPYYRMGYENGFNEGMRVSFNEYQKHRPWMQ